MGVNIAGFDKFVKVQRVLGFYRTKQRVFFGVKTFGEQRIVVEGPSD